MSIMQTLMIGNVRIPINLTISSNTTNYNIYSALPENYTPGMSDVVLTIDAGKVVGSTTISTHALDTGDGWTSGDTLKIINYGYIVGKGGDGGVPVYGNSGAGQNGGPALRLQFATSIDNASGIIGGGGGGGGGGGYVPDDGGGGAGYLPGSGGGGFSGTLTTGGNARYFPYGGAGGGPGVAGGSNYYGGGGGGLGANGGEGYAVLGGTAGLAGHAVDGNSLATWLNTGTRYGTIA